MALKHTFMHIMNCREIAMLLDSDAVAQQLWIMRVQLRVHLWMCWHCRLLARQIRLMGMVARQRMNGTVDADRDFEKRLLRKLL